jgi:hypothetical protein
VARLQAKSVHSLNTETRRGKSKACRYKPTGRPCRPPTSNATVC